MRRQVGGGGCGGSGGSYGFHPWFYPLPHCFMISVEIIGRHCCSRLALVGLGIREAHIKSVGNGIGINPNGLGPYKGRMTILHLPLSSTTSNFIPFPPTSCRFILLPIGGFFVSVFLLGFPVNFSGDWLFPNLKRWKLSTATDYFQISSVGKFLPRTCRGGWRGGRWREKCQLGRCINQRWGEQERTNQTYVLK